MQILNVISFNSKRDIKKPHFYVLNKGLNSGKPMNKPCPNCFVCICETEADKDFYFWLSYVLWKTKAFHFYLRGSVIPFIILREYKQCISAAAKKANLNPANYLKGVKLLKSLDQEEERIKKTIDLIKEAKKAIFLNILNSNISSIMLPMLLLCIENTIIVKNSSKYLLSK